MILIIKSFFVLTKDGKTGSETDSEKSQKEKSGELIFIRGEFVMMKLCNSSAMAPVSDSFSPQLLINRHVEPYCELIVDRK